MLLKNIFDKTVSLIGIIVLVPIFLIVYLLIWIFMSKPILFKQTRVGQRGCEFTIYKFRTMENRAFSNTVSVKGDVRITRLGSILRKYKLDELPELWNVLKGDMSFVGPRPDVPGFMDKLEGEDRKILLLKPGITGPATLKYSNEEEILASFDDPIKYNEEVLFPEKVKINLEYYKNMSLFGDIKIIFRTIFRTNY